MSSLLKNLLLVGKSTQDDLKFEFTKDKCVIISQQLSHMHIYILNAQNKVIIA
jgi:hypothetical protein